jgi:hypothetical protein
VAAKQLKAMADLAGLDDALVELVNEVNLLFHGHAVARGA